MARCVICSLNVDEDTRYKSIYKNTTYYFHSLEEKARFDENPEKYYKIQSSK